MRILIFFALITLPFTQPALSADYVTHLDLAFEAHQGNKAARKKLCNRFEKGFISSTTLHYIHPEKLFTDFEEPFENLSNGEVLVMGIYTKPLPNGFQDYINKRSNANDGTAQVIRYFFERDVSYLEKASKLGNAQANFLLGSYELAYKQGYMGAAIYTNSPCWIEQAALDGHSDAQKRLGCIFAEKGCKEEAGALFADAFIQGESLDNHQHKLAEEFLRPLNVPTLKSQATEKQRAIAYYLKSKPAHQAKN